MKVAVVRPPVLLPFFTSGVVVPPIGPAYIAAALRKKGHDVLLIDAVGLAIEKYTKYERGTLLHGLTFEEIIARIPKDIDCLGISIQFSYEWPVCREFLSKINQAFPKVLLVAGGEHVSAIPEFCLESSPLDVVVVGEGEDTICDLLEVYGKNRTRDFSSVSGIYYKSPDGTIQRSIARKRISDLGEIPMPAWDLLPLEEYLSRGYGFGVDRGRSVPVLASRGCPYQCTFCSSPQMWTPRWKTREPNELLDEISYLQKTYGATNFDFYDLTMIVRREWIVEFCNAITERKMTFTWQLPSGTRSEAIDSEVTSLLYKTGCRNLSYSPESGSIETLVKIKKRISLPKLMTSMRSSVKNGLNVKCNIIFGFPHETWRNIFDSTRAIVRSAIIGIHDISVWVFVPYPGSELFMQLRQSGVISKMDDDYFYRLAAYADITQTFSYCPALSKRFLLQTRVLATFLFYGTSWLIRPWRPFKILLNSLRGISENRVELAARGFIRRTKKNLGLIREEKQKSHESSPIAARLD